MHECPADRRRARRIAACPRRRCVPRQNWHFSDNVAGQGQAEALVQDLRRSNRILVGTSDGTKPFSCPGGPISWQFRTTTRSHFMGDFGHSAEGNSLTRLPIVVHAFLFASRSHGLSSPAYLLSLTITILLEFLLTHVLFIPSRRLNSSSVRSTGRLLLAKPLRHSALSTLKA